MPNVYFAGQEGPNIYFAGEDQNRQQQETIRNVAVIAHVDHGKTTLSDALLHKAGLLHKNRVGDQETGRSLDTLKDEKERGITIKSAAITLNLQVEKEVMEEAKRREQVSHDTEASDDVNVEKEVYVGNLPRNIAEDELKVFFSDHDVGDVLVTFFNAKRSYALVKGDRKILALNGFQLNGRSIVVEPSGDDPMSRLRDFCVSESLSMPTLSVKEVREDGDDDDLTGVGYAALASWTALGGVVIQAPGSYGTRKAARYATAEVCICFLERQKRDHQNIESERKELEAPKEEPPKKESTESNAGLVPLVVNLIDSPGHIEFNAEVTAALRVSDGALVVVDAVEGKAVQTEEVLVQALREGVAPVLMINKVDRLIMDLQLSASEVYDKMLHVVDDINIFIAAHQLEAFPDQRVSFEQGSVCFGSGYFGWSCSIDTFLTTRYTGSADKEKRRAFLMRRDNFIKHIIRPIMRMHRACCVLPWLKEEANDADPVTRAAGLLRKIPGLSGVRLLASDEDPTTIQPRKLLKKAMMAWLPAADALTAMIALHVPSPIRAQKLRAPILYSGDLQDDSGLAIARCDPNGPVVVYISKMSPANGPKDKRMLAFGRVFSGTMFTGDTLRALRTDGSEAHVKVGRIKICGIGGSMTTVASAFAGQLVAVEGIDQALNKAGTLTNSPEGFAIRHMRMSVTPTMQHSVRPKDRRNLTKMVTELRRIVNADATALFYRDKETEEYILAGAGDLHIEVLVSSLLEASGIEVELSDPIIAYRETVSVPSPVPALAKSDNKHNRIYMTASPLEKDLVDALTSELANVDPKDLGKDLVSRYRWSPAETTKIWAIGPEPLGDGNEVSDTDFPTCILVDSTFGLQIPKDFRDNVVAAFQQVVRDGVLVHAPMRGVRFDLVDAKYHSDAPHRRPNSVVPTASRAIRGAFLLAEPHLLEPIYRINITGGRNTLNGAFSIVGQRSGQIEDVASTDLSETIQAVVPVRCATGMADVLRLATQGHAHFSSFYDGMQLIPTNEEAEVISDARQRKHLVDAVPTATDFIDKL